MRLPSDEPREKSFMPKDQNLDFYRRRANELLKLAQTSDKEALALLKRYHPDFRRSTFVADAVALHHVQFVIARENGFSSWLRFKSYIASLDSARKQSSPERLQSIVRSRDLEALDEFIARVPNAVKLCIEPVGTTALHEAAANDWRDGVELLLEHGADINAVAVQSAATPLQLAISYGGSTVALWLLNHGADPTIQANDERSTLRIAAGANDRAIVQALVDRGTQADIFAAIALQDETLIRKLVIIDESVLRQRLRPHEVVTFFPLHLAATANLPRIVDLLIYLGADANAVDEQNRTAIDLALHTGKREAYERLYSNGCRPNPELLALVQTPERSEHIARLHAGIVKGNKDIVVEELDADPTLVNQRLPDVWGSGSTFGATPLHWAAMFGHIDIARLLVERGASLSARDATHDTTPISWATEYRRQEMVEFLKAQEG
jgi:ankyrin repeat protein